MARAFNVVIERDSVRKSFNEIDRVLPIMSAFTEGGHP